MEVSIILDNKLVRNYDFSREEKRTLNNWVGEIEKKDTRLYKYLVFTIAGLNYASKVLADTTDAMDKVNKAGFTVLGLVQTIGYWLCLIMCVVEVLKSIMNGTSKSVVAIMVKYLLIFASLFLMPFLFDLIREIFV